MENKYLAKENMMNRIDHVQKDRMNIETRIKLDKFKPRDYQRVLFDAFENKKYKRILLIWPRRAGKDVAALNLAIRAALTKPQVVFYIFPTYAQGKKVIFDSLTNDGQRILDYIPKEVIDNTNSQEMKIRFKNGSLLQVVGSDNYDSLMGTNPQLCIFSEYALQDPRAYQYIRPILTANEGTAIFLSTPRGKNHLYELYQIARQNPDWYCQKLTVLDTNHIDLEEIEKELLSGEMSQDLVEQEYYTSFDMGVEGSYYAKYLDRMRIKGQIGIVPYEPGFRVNTVWDLGVRDSTTIIAYQICGQTIRIIWCYEKQKEGLEHYVRVLESKASQEGWIYNKHIFPHDIKVMELGSGITRIEKLRQLGIRATVCDDIGIMDGIEAVRSCFAKVWIDEKNCKLLINALENYRQEYDTRHKVYKSQPLHSWASHFADAMRYLAVSLPKTRDGMSQDDADRIYQEGLGYDTKMPAVFRDEIQGY